jgi:tetratricopeptide (TPR) repeat protein
VDAAIETDVMCVGDTICLQVRVISAFPEEKTLWIADYKEEKSQILNLYTRITKQIANEVRVELTTDEDRLLAETQTVDPEAIDAYMRGLFYLDRINKVSLQKAKEHFNAAIEIERDWAAPYSGLAEVGSYQMQIGAESPSTVIPMIHKNLDKALELDPNSSISHYRKAVIAVWTEWNWKKGEKEFLRSLERNPNNALCQMFYAHLLMIQHRSDEALYHAERALELDPLRPFILGLYAAVMIMEGDLQSAKLYAEKALSIDPNHEFTKDRLLQIYIDTGNYENWFELWKERVCWDDEVISTIETVLEENGFVPAIEELLRLNERFGNADCQLNIWSKVQYNIQVKNYDKALDYLDKLYEIHSPGMPYISTRFYNPDQLKDYSRYIALLEKMNLPLPDD